jgi:hypothetical protein
MFFIKNAFEPLHKKIDWNKEDNHIMMMMMEQLYNDDGTIIKYISHIKNGGLTCTQPTKLSFFYY